MTHLEFSRAGNWGIELLAKQGNEPTETIRFAVKVLSAAISPAVGSPAPRSHNLIASDVKNLRDPVVDVVRTLLPVYEKRVAFTHQEIWQDFASKKMFPTVEEWQLDTEPWIFVVDSEGIIRSRFEGLVTAQEIESALQQVL